MYHLRMENPGLEPTQKKTRKIAGIWLAWVVALGFHAIILCLPIRGEKPDAERGHALIELQLTQSRPTPVPPETPPPAPSPKPIQEMASEPVSRVAEAQPEVTPEKIEPPLLTSIPRVQVHDRQRDLDNMSESERSQLTSAVLLRQYITEESEADWIFGRQIEPGHAQWQKEFHYPVRQSMISMLDKPLPDSPFAYQEGLVYFAYDPGVKGDLQRFWDVITPEFGWRTRYGTEVKCIWVLVIAACGWK